MSELLTVKEAAEYLATKEGHVRRLVSERRIAFVKIGGLVRFRRGTLDQFIADGTVEAQQ